MYNKVSKYFYDNDLLKDLEYYSEIKKSKYIKKNKIKYNQFSLMVL